MRGKRRAEAGTFECYLGTSGWYVNLENWKVRINTEYRTGATVPLSIVKVSPGTNLPIASFLRGACAKLGRGKSSSGLPHLQKVLPSSR